MDLNNTEVHESKLQKGNCFDFCNRCEIVWIILLLQWMGQHFLKHCTIEALIFDIWARLQTRYLRSNSWSICTILR